ncbi:MAG: 3-methyl-2-oxobutanoate hydroxymethyltransferase [Candidatus Omnitrophica bacterium]|nr:3-methyl-2-oxobutanoate hydroxymethyltransferase [Candidatus Omnitrophota bacterium]MDD5488644.1 3-methyl-2-oxobutanoate hydroxymethyltransferase [Candidatus Omnitrophota bacterium]
MDNKFTVLDFARKKKDKKKITMLTAYDYPTAQAVDNCGIDAVLVGDSLAMTVLGYESTVNVTMDEMLHHARAVRRGVKRAFLIGDMPFMSFQASDEDAVRNAGRFVKEAGCEAVKIEGGEEVSGRVSAIGKAGIPVVGHIGLTPQSVSKLGGYKVQGKDDSSAGRLMRDAKALEKAGCLALILECLPAGLAGEITEKLAMPTIGIGAGVHCDGQVLVINDIIGLFEKFTPKFVKRYADVNSEIKSAVNKFREEVESEKFPDDGHSFS